MDYSILDSEFHKCFDLDKQDEVYQPFGQGDHPQMNQFVTAEIGSRKTHAIILDYGAGCGSLINGYLGHVRGAKQYICVNHSGETVPGSKQPINDYLRAELARVKQDKPYRGVDFPLYDDNQLVDAMYTGTPLFQADLAVCLNVLHHIPLFDLPTKLASLLYHLAPGGMLLIGDTCAPIFAETERFWWNFDTDLPAVLDERWLEVSGAKFDGKTADTSFARVTRLSDKAIGDVAAFVDRLTQRCWTLYEGKAAVRYQEMRQGQGRLMQEAQRRKLPADSAVPALTAAEQKAIYFAQISWRDILRQLHEAQARPDETRITAARPTFSPGDEAVILTFRRATNGEEQTVLDQATEVAGPAKKVLVTLGLYDVVTLEEFTDLDTFRAAALTTQPIQNVFNTNSHACFTWKPYHDPTAPVDADPIRISLPLEELDGQLLGLCFLKIDPAHLHQFGVHAEASIVLHLLKTIQQSRKISKAKRQTFKLSFLGSFGWSEVVLLISAQDIDTLSLVAAIVRDVHCPLDPKHQAGLLTSFTVLGVERQHLQATGEALGEDLLAISVTAKGGQKAKLRKILTDKYQLELYTVMGKVDFLGIRHPRKADVIGELMELRRCPEVLSTTTLPLVGLPTGSWSPATPPKPVSAWDIARAQEYYAAMTAMLSAQATPMPDGSTAAAMMVKQVLCEYITCAGDPLIRDAVLDLAANLFTVCDHALECLPETSADMREQDVIYTAARSVLTALKQRYAGTYDTIYNANDINTSGMSIGVHRLLGATSSLIASALERYAPDHPWRGFVVYGQDLQPYRDHFGKFNFPGERAFDLWGVKNLWYLHEIGHEFASQFTDEDMLPLPPETENKEEAFDMLREIIADLFCFLFGFQEDIGLYLVTIQNYFNRLITDNVSKAHPRMRYLLRLMAIHLYTQPPLARRDYVRAAVQQLLNDLRNHQYTIPASLDPAEVLDYFFAGSGEQDKRVADWLQEYILKPFDQTQRFSAEELEQFQRWLPADSPSPQVAERLAQVGKKLSASEQARILSEVFQPTKSDLRLAKWITAQLALLAAVQAEAEDTPAMQHFLDAHESLSWSRENKLQHLATLVQKAWKPHIFAQLQAHALMGFPLEDVDIRRIADHLRRGKIVTTPLLGWERVVMELHREGAQTTIAQHVAMIMSLWHSWTRWQHPVRWEALRNEAPDGLPQPAPAPLRGEAPGSPARGKVAK